MKKSAPLAKVSTLSFKRYCSLNIIYFYNIFNRLYVESKFFYKVIYVGVL